MNVVHLFKYIRSGYGRVLIERAAGRMVEWNFYVDSFRFVAFGL